MILDYNKTTKPIQEAYKEMNKPEEYQIITEGGLGILLGGLTGFLVGGPIAAIAGAYIGHRAQEIGVGQFVKNVLGIGGGVVVGSVVGGPLGALAGGIAGYRVAKESIKESKAFDRAQAAWDNMTPDDNELPGVDIAVDKAFENCKVLAKLKTKKEYNEYKLTQQLSDYGYSIYNEYKKQDEDGPYFDDRGFEKAVLEQLEELCEKELDNIDNKEKEDVVEEELNDATTKKTNISIEFKDLFKNLDKFLKDKSVNSLRLAHDAIEKINKDSIVDKLDKAVKERLVKIYVFITVLNELATKKDKESKDKFDKIFSTSGKDIAITAVNLLRKK
jgi:hypothetical protein